MPLPDLHYCLIIERLFHVKHMPAKHLDGTSPPNNPQASQGPAADPAASPEASCTQPQLLALRDISLGNKARILTSNKHFIRRLNNAADQSIITAHLHIHTLRSNKRRTITFPLLLRRLVFTVPARQNITEMPINHQSIHQQLPTSLLRRNIGK